MTTAPHTALAERFDRTPAKHLYTINHASRTDIAYVIVFTLTPGKQAEFRQLLTPVLDAMRHEAAFCSAMLHRDPETPNRFMLYETWADAKDVIEVQVHREYRQAFWAGLPQLLEVAREIQTWVPMRSDFNIGQFEQRK